MIGISICLALAPLNDPFLKERFCDEQDSMMNMSSSIPRPSTKAAILTCLVEYAKAAAEDLLIRVQVSNHGPEQAQILVLPPRTPDSI